LAAGYLKLNDSIDYVTSLQNVKGVVASVSKEKHAKKHSDYSKRNLRVPNDWQCAYRSMGFMGLMDLSEKEIKNALTHGKIKICVIGLGRIGLPTASMFAAAGAQVVGADIDKQVVFEVNSGGCRFEDEPGLKELVREVVKGGRFKASCNISSSVAKSDLIVVCVPTPVNESKVPYFRPILRSCVKIGKSLKRGVLVVIESTVSPGTVEDKMIPLIEKESGMKAGEDFGIASCPERASPGETLKHLKSVPRVIGGIDSRSVEVAATIYACALGVKIMKVANPKTANAVKLTENIFRDVNIALMNEFAILYEKLGIDTIEVINTCATKWNFVPHYPGAGVGGPCLPANAYYIIDEGLRVGYIPYLIRMAREINDRMPDHVVALVTEALNDIGKVVSKSKIALLGVSYKAGVHDLQMTPFERVYHSLEAMGASMAIYDPMFRREEVFGTVVAKNLNDAIEKADCIVIGTSHSEFRNLNLTEVAKICRKPAALVDTQNLIVPNEARKHGFSYLGVGRRMTFQH
jgi:nucleotide sugar dehydrogenase